MRIDLSLCWNSCTTDHNCNNCPSWNAKMNAVAMPMNPDEVRAWLKKEREAKEAECK